MPTYMMRALVNGKMIGHPVEAETEEEAKAKFDEALPILAQQAAEARADAGILLKNEGLNGRKFLSIEFQCAACGSALEAEFRDGYLQVSPCPTCLGELESMVAASKRFLERKK
jgi:hypothetical protein